ncbi:MAG: hypothetical protein KGN98_03565 [Alphaproteobacteria bacterium]|nr:hypothetical protein [Alphaproteobacteria bacterium]
MDEPNSPQTASAPDRAIRGLVISAVILFILGLAVIGWTLLRTSPADKASTVGVPAPLGEAAAPPPPPALAPADAETRIATIENRLAEADRLSARALNDAAKAERLLILLSARRAVDRGRPLGYLESALAQQFGGAYPGDVTLIVDYSRRPVRLDTLTDELTLIEPNLATKPDENGWLGSFMANVRGLAVVRPTNQPSDAPAKKLERAHRALARDDVAVALREVATLPGAPKAKAWMEKARRYIAIHAALDRLEAATILNSQPQR